ncbi:MAG TPA: SAM-dependent methyltransferase, partial [Friedmanniella sp.]
GAEPRTMVFFEAPHRTAETLAAMVDAFGGQRPAAVCRELTKTYEEVVRGPLSELAVWAAEQVRGEVTLVVAGAETPEVDLDSAATEVAALVAGGARLKPAVAEVAERDGIARNALYAAALELTRRPVKS